MGTVDEDFITNQYSPFLGLAGTTLLNPNPQIENLKTKEALAV
jgi:hypothetical protein